MAYTFTTPKKTTPPSAIEELNAPSTQAPNFDPSQQHSMQENAKKKTLRTLNAIKIVSPILEAIMINPGADSDASSQTKTFKELVNTTSSLSSKTCLMLGLDPEEDNNRWIRNVFERLFAQLIKSQWVENNKINVSNIENLIQTILDHETVVLSEYKAMNLDMDSDVRIHLIKSMLPVLTQPAFKLNRNIEEDIEHIMTLILQTARENLSQIIDPNADAKQKADILKLLIVEGGQLYAAAWRTYSVFAENAVKKMTPEEKEKLNKKYPKGFPITSVDEEFKTYFNKLLLVTQKLIPSKSGNIENRMKQ